LRVVIWRARSMRPQTYHARRTQSSLPQDAGLEKEDGSTKFQYEGVNTSSDE
jgi:hypothetical protein